MVLEVELAEDSLELGAVGIPGKKACIGRAGRQALGLCWACFSYGPLCWWLSWPAVVEREAKVWAWALGPFEIKTK